MTSKSIRELFGCETRLRWMEEFINHEGMSPMENVGFRKLKG